MIAKPLLVLYVLPGPDTEKHVVRMRVGLPQVVHVVCAHQWDPELLGDRRQSSVDDELLRDPLVLHLEEEIARSQYVAERCSGGERLPGLLPHQVRGHLALQAAAETDQTARVLGQEILVDPRFVVEALGVAGRHEFN